MRGSAEIVGGGIGGLFTGYMLAKQGLSHWEQGAARAAPGIDLYLSLHKEGDRAGDEVPHIFTRKSRLRLGKFLITGAKKSFATISARTGLMQCSKEHHSKISSARPDSGNVMVIPSARAVFKLMYISTFVVACCTGRSAGLSPLRIRPA
jgi:glycine/D-amino acid oxidase-like deaminating enzyme